MEKQEPDFIKQLKSNLQNFPLPGIEAHKKMAGFSRTFQPPVQTVPKIAGVLILFFPVDNIWNTLLIKRVSNNPNDKHKGQISFPGGSKDPQDLSIIHTALREAREEVGVFPESVHVIGTLSDLYIPVSNFQVFPVIGLTFEQPDFKIQEDEVADILQVPFDYIAQPNIIRKTNIELRPDLKLMDVPHFEIFGHIVWGATAMIISELLDVIRRSS